MAEGAPGPSRQKVNLRSTAVKRIMQEASELSEPDDDFVAAPLETDIFEWHCTLRGVEGSEYSGGLYHLRILLPPTYPMSAPDIILTTPNGRFELGKKICIDGLTSFHAGSWQPAWGVRTAVLGLRSFWMQGGEALSAIGALDYPKEERRRLAKLSQDWKCPSCGIMKDQIPERTAKPPAQNVSEAIETIYFHSDQSEDSVAPEVLNPATAPDPPTPRRHEVAAPITGATEEEHVGSVPAGSGVQNEEPRSEPRPSNHAPLSSEIVTETALEAPDTPQIAPPGDGALGSETPAIVPSPTEIPLPPPALRSRTVPMWLDASIASGVAILAVLLVKRLGGPLQDASYEQL